MNEPEIRTQYLDPDYRKDPKTELFCCRCQRDLNPDRKYYYVFLGENGYEATHPEDAHLAKNPIGWCPIGPECVKHLDKEWYVEEVP